MTQLFEIFAVYKCKSPIFWNEDLYVFQVYLYKLCALLSLYSWHIAL